MNAPRLKRETFETSRLLDFCSERELTKQIGHDADHWPLVILKELTDNALDAAEPENCFDAPQRAANSKGALEKCFLVDW
jgi:hypothetical protein